MPINGGSTSTTTNFISKPYLSSSFPHAPISQHGGSPSIVSPGYRISQHVMPPSSSTPLSSLSSSSTPSIFRLDIRGSHTTTSPSTSTSSVVGS